MTPNGPQPYPPQQPSRGARSPRPPHVPQPFSRGGWVLAGLVAVYLLSLWFAFFGVELAIFVVIYGGLALVFVDLKGFTSFSGRLPWNTLSGGGKFWLVCGFIFVPEIMFPLALWFAVRDHLRATNTSPFGLARGYWQRLMAASRGMQIGVAAAALVGVIAFCSLSGVAAANSAWNTSASVSGSSQTSQNNLSSSSGNANGQIAQVAAPTATDIPTATPIPPTPTPKPHPTATPRPVPTATPRPTGVNGNPWGYEFTSGSYIYNPPSNFCAYFACIKSFWTSTNGYVEECQDGDFSHSGGRSGSCSYHGGNWRPLLKP